MKNYFLIFLIPLLFSCQDDIIDENTGGYTFTQGNGVFFDGHQYSSVVYGNGQEWMSENLKTTIFSNGDSIIRKDGFNWQDLGFGENVSAFTIYNGNDPDLSSYDSYGYLYNFNSASDSRNICPQGWHVPSVQEWEELGTYLGGVDVAGGIMTRFKPINFVQYDMGVWGGQASCCPFGNESGFSALPTGKINEFVEWQPGQPLFGQSYYGLDIDDSSYYLGYTPVPPFYRSVSIFWNPNNNLVNYYHKSSTWWWTSSMDEWGQPMKIVINFDSPELSIQPQTPNTGICIRCLKD